MHSPILPTRFFQLARKVTISHKVLPLACAQCRSSKFQQRLQPLSTSAFRCNKESSPEPPKDKDQWYYGSFISWKSVVVASVCGALGIMTLKQLVKSKDADMAAKKQVMIGKADLGGDWTLIDHHGNRRNSQDFLGQWVLIYFGFTFCPDVCPEQMDKLVETVRRVDDDPSIPKITPIFITLDPERDTPVLLARYVSEFSPKIIGMTGSKEQIAQAAKAYRIYYSVGPKDEDNDYIVDHSIIQYLVDPEGNFCEYFGQNKTAGEVYQGCKKHMKTWNQQHPQAK